MSRDEQLINATISNKLDPILSDMRVKLVPIIQDGGRDAVIAQTLMDLILIVNTINNERKKF